VAVFSPSFVLGAFVKNQVGIAVWIHIWEFYSVPLVFMSVFVPVPKVYSTALQYSLKSGVVIPPVLLFSPQHCLCYSRSFVFQTNFRIDFSISMNVIGI
jgi:hypothetical protein